MKLKKTFGIIATMMLLLTWSSHSMVQAQGIDFFHGSFEEAKMKAKKENKLIFMDAYTSWCGPCKKMAREAFPDAQVGEYFNTHFVNVKVDMERGEGPQFARRYRVMAYPSLFFIRGDGTVAHRSVGMKTASALLALGKAAETKK